MRLLQTRKPGKVNGAAWKHEAHTSQDTQSITQERHIKQPAHAFAGTKLGDALVIVK